MAWVAALVTLKGTESTTGGTVASPGAPARASGTPESSAPGEASCAPVPFACCIWIAYSVISAMPMAATSYPFSPYSQAQAR
jgi:hypothetical protein